MKGFPFVQMEVVERSQYDCGTYFLIQTVSERNGWEVAEVRTDIPWQRNTAQLLSAAPDMLEALEDLIAATQRLNPCPATVEKARAAIAKAKGEAQ